MLLKKGFTVPADAELVCFHKGDPSDCQKLRDSDDRCHVRVTSPSRFDRVIDSAVLPRRLGMSLFDWRRNSHYKFYFVSFGVQGKNISELSCSDEANFPTVADFKKHFGNYFEWEPVTGPLKIEP